MELILNNKLVKHVKINKIDVGEHEIDVPLGEKNVYVWIKIPLNGDKLDSVMMSSWGMLRILIIPFLVGVIVGAISVGVF